METSGKNWERKTCHTTKGRMWQIELTDNSMLEIHNLQLNSHMKNEVKCKITQPGVETVKDRTMVTSWKDNKIGTKTKLHDQIVEFDE